MKYVGLIFRLHVSKYMNNPFPTIFDLNNDLLQVLLVILVVLSSEKKHLHIFAPEAKESSCGTRKICSKNTFGRIYYKRKCKNHHEFKKMHKHSC